MKKIIALAAALVLSTTTVFAAGGVSLIVDGKPIEAQGTIVDGRTLVPARGVFENIDYDVEWDAETKTATLSRGIKNVVVQAGGPSLVVTENDGTQRTVELDVPAQIIDGSMMLPLRAIGEAVGAEFEWDAQTKTVTVTPHNGMRVEATLELD